MMSSPRAAKQRSVVAARKHPAPVPKAVRAVEAAVRVHEHDQHDQHAEPKSDFSVFGDPLLGMAIGTAILFFLLAALVAST